jgi:hypothetical protein
MHLAAIKRPALIMVAIPLMIGIGLTACSSTGGKKPMGSTAQTKPLESGGGLGQWIGLGKNKNSKAVVEAGIGVNAYLWRATLDTISFMPLTSADPWGGTVITDWYANPTKSDERFKATIYILDSRLRADALNVNINKEILVDNQWKAAEVAAQTSIDIENSILTRAKELRQSDIKK